MSCAYQASCLSFVEMDHQKKTVMDIIEKKNEENAVKAG